MTRSLLATGLALATLALGPAGEAAAQEAVGQVNGTVFDSHRKGMAGLTVAAIASSGSLYGTSTDEGGRYAFKGLEASTYTIVVAPTGAGVSRKDGIRVRPLFRSIVDFNMAADAPGGSLPPLQPASSEGAGGPAGTAGTSVTCSLAGVNRQPAPDALIVLTPVDGAGQLRRARSEPDGRCVLTEVPSGTYRITVRAPGFITWSLGPAQINGPGSLKMSLLLVPFPMGFDGTIEDKLVPVEPIPPAKP